MLEELKKEVYEANMMLPKYGLVVLTWGNVSGIDENREYIVIKPSGIPFDQLTPDDMVVVDMDGRVVEGKHAPSSDTDTHLQLYKSLPCIGGVAHSHSVYATSFAQAGRSIKPYGTMHGDYFFGNIPCSRKMTKSELESNRKKNTALLIAETVLPCDPTRMHAALVHSHGPFTWGKNATSAVENAVVLEKIAQMAMNTEILQVQIGQNGGIPMQHDMLEEHYNSKH